MVKPWPTTIRRSSASGMAESCVKRSVNWAYDSVGIRLSSQRNIDRVPRVSPAASAAG